MKKFKKGDYIVLTNSPIFKSGAKPAFSTIIPINYIFKQKIDHEYLMMELDAKGGKDNGWSGYRFVNKTNWRYANNIEIKIYEDLKVPYNVIEINIDNFSII